MDIKHQLEQALQAQQSGLFEQAEQVYKTLLTLTPNQPEVLHLYGVLKFQIGQLEKAIALIQQAIKLQPENPRFHNNIALVYKSLQNYEKAQEHYLKIIRFSPQYIEAYAGLADTCIHQQQWHSAIQYLNTYLRYQPQHYPMRISLAEIYLNQGDYQAAYSHYKKCQESSDMLPQALQGIGKVLYFQQKLEPSESYLKKALELKSDLYECYHYLALIKKLNHSIDEAIDYCQLALKYAPHFWPAALNMGIAQQLLGMTTEALATYQRTYELNPADSLLFRMATILPPIFQDIEDMEKWRHRLYQEVDKLLDRDLKIDNPLEELSVTNFYLNYHAKNDRDIQEKVARLCIKASPSLLYTAPHCQNPFRVNSLIKIGFVSENFKDHSIGKFTKGVIAHLSREQFEVHVFSFGDYQDLTAQFIQSHSDYFYSLPFDLKQARSIIAEQQLDILLYTDIGMEASTYFLAFSRLAPIQCVTWGNGLTTGLSTIDYFISSCQESENANQYYSEQLIKPRHLFPYYYKPTISENLKSRNDYGLLEDVHIYVCLQSIFKFHPEFDEVLASILEGDPDGHLYLLEGRFDSFTQLIKNRFQSTLKPVFDRVHFLPRQSPEDFLNLIALADVNLDPLYTVGGISTFDTLISGTPIVTYPLGDTLRGRVTSALYCQMGIDEYIANSKDEYVSMAIKIATNENYREEFQTAIRHNMDLFYENIEAVKELEEILIQLVEDSIKE